MKDEGIQIEKTKRCYYTSEPEKVERWVKRRREGRDIYREKFQTTLKPDIISFIGKQAYKNDMYMNQWLEMIIDEKRKDVEGK